MASFCFSPMLFFLYPLNVGLDLHWFVDTRGN